VLRKAAAMIRIPVHQKHTARPVNHRSKRLQSPVTKKGVKRPRTNSWINSNTMTAPNPAASRNRRSWFARRCRYRPAAAATSQLPATSTIATPTASHHSDPGCFQVSCSARSWTPFPPMLRPTSDPTSVGDSLIPVVYHDSRAFGCRSFLRSGYSGRVRGFNAVVSLALNS
jgi:hypothetical protein